MKKNKRPLNSDELGEKGEHTFAVFCVDASLVCNKAVRDRTGWDYIVEYPFPELEEFELLDLRPQPLEARVQVKAVWAGATSIKLRLSSAERLAKMRQPTYIFVLEFSNDLTSHALYGIHVINDSLSRILKAVRQCQAEGSIKLNRKFVTIPFPKEGEKLLVSGNAIAEYIKLTAGDNYDEYVVHKMEQVRELGGSAGRYSGKFVFETNDKNEIADVFLGLRPGKIQKFSLDEIRWGIKLPVHRQTEPSLLSVTPNAIQGELLLRDMNSGKNFFLQANIFVSSVVSDKPDFRKIRVSTPFLELVLDNEQAAFEASTDKDENALLDLDEHMKLMSIRSIIMADSGDMQILYRRRPLFKFRFAANSTPKQKENIKFGIEVITKLKRIVSHSGFREFKFSIFDMNKNLDNIDFIDDIINNPANVRVNPVTIKTTSIFPDIVESEILIIGKMKISDNVIAFSAIGDVLVSGSDNTKIFNVSNFQAREVEIIANEDDVYEDFRQRMQEITGLRLVIEFGGISKN